MSASGVAHHAIANAIDDDRTLSLFGYTRAAHALAADMPDGRTIAQHLDDGEVAMSIVRVLVDLGRIGSRDGAWMSNSPAAELLARLEAQPRPPRSACSGSPSSSAPVPSGGCWPPCSCREAATMGDLDLDAIEAVCWDHTTLALVAEVRDLRAENERLQAQNTRLATMGNLLLIELEAEADG